MKPKLLLGLALVLSEQEMAGILFLLPVLISAYLASLLCRFAWRRQSGVRWYFALMAAVATGGFEILFVALGLSIQAGQTPYAIFFYVPYLKWLPVSALLPALIVTWYYRRKSSRRCQP
jgi:hypothetical protein